MRKNGNYDSVPIVTPTFEDVPVQYVERLEDLFEVWRNVRSRNHELTTYYNMDNTIKNLDISIPDNFTKINSVVGWCKKAVQTHAIRSSFDGYVFAGETNPELDSIVRLNRLRTLYQRAVASSLVHGVSAFTIMKGREGQPPVKIRTHSANQFAVLWDKDEDRIACGIILSDVDRNGEPSRYIAHFPDAVLDIYKLPHAQVQRWACDVQYHKLGRPMMEVLVNDPDDDSPLGHTLINKELRGIVDKAMRDVLRMEIGAEFFTFPQRYFLGAAEDLFSVPDGEVVGENEDGEPIDTDGNVVKGIESPVKKWNAYIGAIMAISRDENGDVPQAGQFSPTQASNFTAMFENDAQRFSGATNVPLAQLGVLSNTYTSSEALSATNDPLVLQVENMNLRNAEVMEDIARMVLAVYYDVSLNQLPQELNGVQALFVDPSMPTISARADAWTKIGAQDDRLVGTRIYYENLGLSKPVIDRIMQETQSAGAIKSLNTIAESIEKAVQPQVVTADGGSGQ